MTSLPSYGEVGLTANAAGRPQTGRAYRSAVLALSMALCTPAQAIVRHASDQVAQIAARHVSEAIAYDPAVALGSGAADQFGDRLPRRAPPSIRRYENEERGELRQLLEIPSSSLSGADRATYLNLREALESDLQLRVCKRELWNVDHFSGWQISFVDLAAAQPVATARQRAEALRRWSDLPRFVDVEIANLREGLGQGYSAPASIVRRVLGQIRDLLASTPERSPFYSPAARSHDPAFQEAFRSVLVKRIDKALARYRDYLANDYLPRARDGIGLSALPNGSECYAAFLRAATTTQMSAKEVFDRGQETVAANLAEIGRLGEVEYGTSLPRVIIGRVKADERQHFSSPAELLDFTRSHLLRGQAATAALVDALPRQDVVVEPETAIEDGSGISSHYLPNSIEQTPATFITQLRNYATSTRAETEVTLAHETWPGHHLQIAYARELAGASPLTRLVQNSAYVEGWARYAEGLAEEANIYDTPTASIMRRAWPGHGMVLDPGIHMFHWSRKEAIAYLLSSGRFSEKSAEDMVDRIAVLPAQLTAYDVGAFVFRKLRGEAQKALGARFDVKAFHRTVLEEGPVPLTELEAHATAWIRNAERRGE